jgi:NADPH-dependent glutamate synthase beta subunit-like oxidoreductase/NAD-dependent dihydropyrimidine dehydrogenase PreA subunit
MQKLIVSDRGGARLTEPPQQPVHLRALAEQATRRLRLLALVDIGFVPPHACDDGPGYELATGDAQWFLDNIPCQRACPAETDVARYIALIADGRYDDAYAVNWSDNIFPSCLGHVCARPCEDACRRKYVDAPVGIRVLKRVAAEQLRAQPTIDLPAANGHTVAIVGAGVAGLAAARELALRGYQVRVYERYPVPGGMLWAGVPAWRLPRETIAEDVRSVIDLGVEVRYQVEVGRDVLLSDLAATNDAVVVTTGCPESVALSIPGETLDGVSSGLAFLEAVNLAAEPPDLRGERVVTIGGGYTSIDCARSALRCGATQSVLVYRRSRHEMPVEAEEFEEAEREGVEFRFLAAPLRILGQHGHVRGLELVRNEFRAPDRSGRCAVAPLAGSEFVLGADRVIIAVGQRTSSAFDPEGLLAAGHSRIWLAGDAASRPGNFIAAIADGKRVAASIDSELGGTEPDGVEGEFTPLTIQGPRTSLRRGWDGIAGWSLTTPSRRLRWGDDYLATPRPVVPLRPLRERGLDGTSVAQEVELGLSEAAALAGASRCLQCQLNIFIDPASCILCNACVDVCPQQCIEMIVPDRLAAIDGDPAVAADLVAGYAKRGAAMLIDEEACIRCGRCVDRCPTGSLTMEHFRPVSRS